LRFSKKFLYKLSNMIKPVIYLWNFEKIFIFEATGAKNVLFWSAGQLLQNIFSYFYLIFLVIFQLISALIWHFRMWLFLFSNQSDKYLKKKKIYFRPCGHLKAKNLYEKQLFFKWITKMRDIFFTTFISMSFFPQMNLKRANKLI
jgi:hypothetical protein